VFVALKVEKRDAGNAHPAANVNSMQTAARAASPRIRFLPFKCSTKPLQQNFKIRNPKLEIRNKSE
jgi:hypothetical protein